MQNKIGATELDKVAERLGLSELILPILSGGQGLIHYENLLNKILKLQDYESKVFTVMSDLLPKFCEKGIEVSEVGFRSFMRVYEKLLHTNE